MKRKVRIRLSFDTAPVASTLFGHEPIKSFMFLINKDECVHIHDVEKFVRSFLFHLQLLYLLMGLHLCHRKMLMSSEMIMR